MPKKQKYPVMYRGAQINRSVMGIGLFAKLETGTARCFFRSRTLPEMKALIDKRITTIKAPTTKTITLTKKQYKELMGVLDWVLTHRQESYEETRARHGPRDPATKSHIYLKALHAYDHIKEAA